MAKWMITCVCHHHQSAASFLWEIMIVVLQLGQIQPEFVHKMVWLWVPAVYRGFWLLNSSVPSTPAQIAGSERLHQGNFPTQRPCRVLSTCWGRNLSPTDLCKSPDGRISGSTLDSSVMWMSCPGWGTTSSGSISASLCLWCGLSCGWGPHSCIPWSSTSTEPQRRIRTRLSAENRAEVFWFHPWPLISFPLLLLDVPKINRILGPPIRQQTNCSRDFTLKDAHGQLWKSWNWYNLSGEHLWIYLWYTFIRHSTSRNLFCWNM